MPDKEQELLTGEEVMDLVTDFHFSGKTNRYILVRSAEKLIIVKLKSLGYEQVWEKCPHCYGTGQGHTRECPTCNGTGKVRIQFKLPDGIEKKIKDIFDCQADLCLNPTIIGKDDCGYESHSVECFACMKKQILSLIRQDKE